MLSHFRWLAALLAATAPEGDVVGTHPMFGPHAGDDMDRQRVVLCRGRGDAGFARVRRLFELFGADVITADAAEHDAQMALIQVLVHEKTMVLGSVLERLQAPLGRSLEFASPVYRAELAMVGRLYSQEADLYADILTNNPDGTRVSALFAEEARRFALAVQNGERAWILGRFREVASYLTTLLQQKNITLELAATGDTTVYALPGEPRQVLLNLVRNAYEATSRPRAFLRITLRGEPDGVAITVADEGSGIDPAILGSLFQFGVSSKGSQGNGMGLWAAKQILERHGGTIRVDSVAGEGTTFTLWWPRTLAART